MEKLLINHAGGLQRMHLNLNYHGTLGFDADSENTLLYADNLNDLYLPELQKVQRLK